MAVHRRQADYSVRDDVLNYVAALLERGRIAEVLEQLGVPRGTRYSGTVLLSGLLILAILRQTMGYAALMHLYWDVLTPGQRLRLGLPAELPVLANRRAYTAEYQRLFTACERFSTALAPVTMPRNRRITKAEHTACMKAAQNDPVLASKRAALIRLASLLVQCSVPRELLDPWDGSALVDDHQLVLLRSDGRPGDAKYSKWPAIPFVGLTNQSRKAKWAWAISVCLLKPLHTPDDRYVPEVVLSLSFGAPGSQTTQRTLECVDAVLASDIFPDRRGYRPLVVGDQGFNHHGLAEGLVDRGFDVIREHARRVPLAPTHLDHGVSLINGRPFCIGGVALAQRLRPLSDEAACDDIELLRHHDLVEQVRAAEMPVHEPPTRMLRRPPGRPGPGSRPEELYRMVVVSPCRVGRYCAVGNPGAAGTDVPVIPNPPQGPRDTWPATCTQSYTTVWLTGEQLRKYEGELYGSFEHDDRYGNARSRDERGQNLVSNKNLGDLGLEKFEFWSFPMIILSVAACTVAGNRAAVNAWYRDRELGVPQPASLAARRLVRRRRLERARAERNARRSRRSGRGG
jgi:hypothetical protein